MALGLRWGGTGVFLATEIRVQFHEWLAIVTGTLTPGALLIFVAVLAPDPIGGTLICSLVFSMVLIGPRGFDGEGSNLICLQFQEIFDARPLFPPAARVRHVSRG